MNIENDGPVVTFTASAAINLKCRAKLTGDGTVGPAGAGEESIGVSQNQAAIGDLVGIKMWAHDRIIKVAASKAIAVNTAIYGAAAGQISDAASGAAIGKSLHAAAAAGDEISIFWKGYEA